MILSKNSFLVSEPRISSLKIFPSFKNRILRQWLAVYASCVTISMVAFIRSFSIPRLSKNIPADLESSAPVGSSASIRDGLVTMALAHAIRYRCPPDIS